MAWTPRNSRFGKSRQIMCFISDGLFPAAAALDSAPTFDPDGKPADCFARSRRPKLSFITLGTLVGLPARCAIFRNFMVNSSQTCFNYYTSEAALSCYTSSFSSTGKGVCELTVAQFRRAAPPFHGTESPRSVVQRILWHNLRIAS